MTFETKKPKELNKFTRLAMAIGGGVSNFARVVAASPMPGDFGHSARLARKEDAILAKDFTANVGPTSEITGDNVLGGELSGDRIGQGTSDNDPRIISGLEQDGLIGRDFSGHQPKDPLPRFNPNDK